MLGLGKTTNTDPLGAPSGPLQGRTQTYPIGLDDIPYASFFSITKYEYMKGLQAAAQDKRQNDVLGGLGRNRGAKAATNAIRNIGTGLFNGGQGTTAARNDVLLKRAIRENLQGRFQGASSVRAANKRPEVAQDYSNVDFPITTQDGREFKNASELIEYKKKAKLAADTAYSVCKLPLPNEFQYSYDASWSNEFKLGTMARILEDPAGTLGQMATTGGAFAAGEVGKQLLGGALSQFSAGLSQSAGGINIDVGAIAQAGLKGAFNPLGVNSQLTPTNLLGLGGLAPNENAMMMFSRMQMRSFDVTFELFARDDTEAAEIESIIQWFKVGMHPTATPQGTGGLLGFPDVFVLEPMFVPADPGSGTADRAIPHPMMPKTKLCALSRLSVNTTPANNFLTTYTGEIPLQTISLTFNELTALTQSDLQAGAF